MGLTPDSKVLKVYSHLCSRDVDEGLLKMYGLPLDEEDERTELETLQCPHCRSLNTADARVCNNCRMPLSIAEVQDREDKIMEFALEFAKAAAKDPQFAAMMKRYLE